MKNQQLDLTDLDYTVINLQHGDRCGVYIFTSPTKEVLYIGSSTCMWRRVAAHLVDGRKVAWMEGTVVMISTPTITDARRLERQLIERYCPVWNVIFKPQRHHFDRNGELQVIMRTGSRRDRNAYVKVKVQQKGDSAVVGKGKSDDADSLTVMFEQLHDTLGQQQFTSPHAVADAEYERKVRELFGAGSGAESE